MNLVSDKENIDSNTPHGRLMLTMIGAINAFERENMLERQKEGIALAKQRGAYKGRKQIEVPSNWDNVYSQWKSREMTAKQAMEELGMKRTTFYKLVKEHEQAQ